MHSVICCGVGKSFFMMYSLKSAMTDSMLKDVIYSVLIIDFEVEGMLLA